MGLRRSLSALSAVSILLAFGVVAARSRQSDGRNQPSFSTTAQMVPVDTQVTERDTGKIIDTLRKNDFEIYDEGTKREVKLYIIETAPIDFVFLVHRGRGWTNKEGINLFRRTQREAVEVMEAQDRGAVVGQLSECGIDLPMTGDKKAILRALFRMKRRKVPVLNDNGTRLYDALAVAVAPFPKPRDRNRRRVILAFTDGLEDHSKIDRQALTTDLLEADATLNAAIFVPEFYSEGPGVVWIPNTPAPPSAPGTPPTLPSPSAPRWPRGGPHHAPRTPPLDCPGDPRHSDALVEATGGEIICMDKFSDQFPDFLRRIRLRYLLGFYADPSSQREYHRIEVRLTPEAQKRFPTALIRARQGYYSQPGAAKATAGTGSN